MLVTRQLTTSLPEYLEEFVVEALRLALLAGRVPAFVGEGGGTGGNLVPRQAPSLQRVLIEVVLVDSLDFVMDLRSHTDSVPHHEAR